MKWIDKHPPLYVYIGDEWERETDHKIFVADDDKKAWLAADGEKIVWPKKSKVMRRFKI